MAATTAASSNGETTPTGPVMLASPPSGQADQSPLIREYKTALGENGVVSFEQVVQAAFGRRPSPAAGSDQAIHARYYPRLLQSFAEAHKCPVRPNRGGILHYYFADHIDAAVIMTADDQLYVHFKPTGADEVRFLDLLIRMTGVHIKARHVLQKEDYRTIMETVFVVISYCMSSLDNPRSDRGQPRATRERSAALEYLQRECTRAEENLDNIFSGAPSAPTSTACSAPSGRSACRGGASHLLDRSGNFDNYKYLLVAALAGSIGRPSASCGASPSAGSRPATPSSPSSKARRPRSPWPS